MDGNVDGRPSAGFHARNGHRAASRRSDARACGRRSWHRRADDFLFQPENWSRPPSEIRDLLGLLRRFIRHDLAELHKSNVRVSGSSRSATGWRRISRACCRKPKISKRRQHGLVLVVAFNYGGRQEIARAAHRAAADVAAGRLQPNAVTAELLSRYLDAPACPIQTSSFAPRRAAAVEFSAGAGRYSELVFVPVYWPDFDRTTLEGAIAEYHRRERRFAVLRRVPVLA